jgi:molybdopterin molybdotransferase
MASDWGLPIANCQGIESGMITEAEALAHILKSVAPLPPQTAPLGKARDAFSARDFFARLALPVFDNSAMDGYAVVAGSCREGESQRVIGEQPAGVDRGLRIAPGEAVRIFTGAPMPAGADAVVMQEDVRAEGSQIFLETNVAAGEFVRRRGSDLSEGQKIVGAGERLRVQTLGLLAAQGFAEIEVGVAVRAAIVTTGDELMKPNEPLGAGQIYESNSTLVQALFEKSGASVVLREHCADDPAVIEAAFRRAFEHHVLVVVGGVSVGARDFVKSALKSAGAQTVLWRVSVKPGKPFLFGRAGQCAIFGLPGNPVSAFVTFLLFVRPAILRLMGAREEELSLPIFEAQLTEEVRNAGDRPHYVRGRVIRGEFTPVGRQESHALFGLSRANALLRVGPGETLSKCARVPILALD